MWSLVGGFVLAAPAAWALAKLAFLPAFLGLFFSYVITDILMGDRMPQGMEKSSIDNFVDIFLHGILAEGNQP